MALRSRPSARCRWRLGSPATAVEVSPSALRGPLPSSRFRRVSSARSSDAVCVRTSRSFSSSVRMACSNRAGKIGPQVARRRRRIVENRGRGHGTRGSVERPAASRHLVEHQPEREEIRACVQRCAAQLLRRHVGQRADGGAGIGERRMGHHRRLARDVGVELVDARQAEIQDFGPRAVCTMFAGLRSRWTMPLAWAEASASASTMPISISACTSMGPWARRWWRVSPSSSSITRNGTGAVPTS